MTITIISGEMGMCGLELRDTEIKKIREQEICNYFSSTSRASASTIDQQGEDATPITNSAQYP
jgi:hypothetical protein